MTSKNFAKATLTAAALGAVAAAGWHGAPSAIAAPAPANFRTFMIDVVGPATKPIWDFGYADKVSDQDWANIREAATKLTGSVSTISTGGSVAAEQARAKSPVWQDWTKKVSDAATAAKAAADAKDQMALATAGDNLVEYCEGCHMAFDPTAK
jgi:cytochrome c556